VFNECYRYERIAWLPVLITFIIASVVGGKHLSHPAPATPATASAVLSFASTLAGFSISFSSLSTDCTSYYRPNVSRFLKFYTPILKFNVKYPLAGSSFCLPTQDFYSPLCVSTLRLHSFLLKNFYFSQVSLQCFGAAAAIAALSASGKTQIDYFAPLILNKTECCTMVQKWNINIHNGDNGPNGA
jgi:hypothetical protein